MPLTHTVLVTGATGFVGGHLVEALARQGTPVRLLVRDARRLAFPLTKGMEIVKGDVTDASSLEAAVKGATTVLHLAGVLKGLRFEDYERVNAGGTRLLCEAMARAGGAKRLVLVSSLAAAGPCERGQVRTEKDPDAPVSFYGTSKRMGEEIARGFSDRFEVTVLRPGAVYGPRDRDVFEYFKMVRSGIVLLHGDGGQQMSFVHVDDVVQAVLLAAEVPSAAGRTFFVADGEVSTWGAMLRIAGEAMGRKFIEIHVPIPVVGVVAGVADLVARFRGRPGILNQDKVKEARGGAWTCSIEEARKTLGYQPRWALREGVAHTIDWYRRQGLL